MVWNEIHSTYHCTHDVIQKLDDVMQNSCVEMASSGSRFGSVRTCSSSSSSSSSSSLPWMLRMSHQEMCLLLRLGHIMILVNLWKAFLVSQGFLWQPLQGQYKGRRTAKTMQPRPTRRALAISASASSYRAPSRCGRHASAYRWAPQLTTA